jgi:hypothetical protein
MATYSLGLEPAEVKIKPGDVSFVVSGFDPRTGQGRIEVSDPDGLSKGRSIRQGIFGLSAAGTKMAGSATEHRVRKALSGALREEPYSLSDIRIDKPDDKGSLSDANKVDGKIFVGGRVSDPDPIPLQITSIPGDKAVWRAAAGEGWSIDLADPATALEWLHKAIGTKAKDLEEALLDEVFALALDLRHVGSLAAEHVRQAYLVRYGDPSLHPRILSVWLVGPLPKYVFRLGGGWPD